MKSYKNFKRPLNSFMIYRIVINNYLKANNIRYSNIIISKLASKLWKNESEEIKNEYKQLAKTMKGHDRNIEIETVITTSPGTINSVNTEPSPCVQFPTQTLKINSLNIINDNFIIICLH
ncbi:hypothetical protein F8M41_005192 [Gigaspora margarita]|uniref:HMG box domain-containing protein n=1 Tax=Gigaspora margarita TaxID=4874 RepID=A0A8H4AXE6_GIGMA|nr:hypothetical protein F8M41_005192 [Gigaspora margarita]